MKTSFLLAVAGVLSLGMTAEALVLSFEGPDPTTGTGAALSSGFQFTYAILALDDDDNSLGYYVADPDADSATGELVDALYTGPETTGRALNAVDQAILLIFDSPVDLQSFQVVLDDSSLGDFGKSVLFYDAANSLIPALSLPLSQEQRGFIATSPGPLTGIKSVLLPSGAYYDNMALSPVPEPAAALLGLGGLSLFLGRRARGHRKGR